MDGLLLLAFVLPALVSFNLTLSVLSFFFSLVVSFGPSIAHLLSDHASRWAGTLGGGSGGVLVWAWEGLLAVLRGASSAGGKSIAPQLVVSVITLWTVMSTYGVGGALRYGKRGWRFVQPCAGGPRFVLLQFCTWTTTTVALILPWTTVKDLGWLVFLDKVERNDEQASNAMLVAGAALGMLSNSLCVLALLSFESSTPPVTFQAMDQNLRLLETGRIKSRALFGSDSSLWWWLFLILQGALVVFSWQLAFMLETNPLRNQLIEATLLMVVTALTAVPTAITNAIGGKWRHGESAYRLLMPFRGGLRFIVLQALGWSSYALATIVTLTKLYEITFGSNPWGEVKLHERTNTPVALAAMTGVFAYVCIFASLFFFEASGQPSSRSSNGGMEDGGVEEVTTDEDERDSDEDGGDDEDNGENGNGGGGGFDDNDDESTALEIAGVLGKRRGKDPGTVDYLIQWKRAMPVPHQSAMKPTWMNERNLSNEALRMCEKMCPSPRRGGARRGNPTDRSTSPPLRRAAGTLAAAGPAGSGQGKLLTSPRESIASISDDWEELEDENGNAFFFNARTGESRKA